MKPSHHSLKFYRILISSANLLSWTLSDGWYQIDIPEVLVFDTKKNWQYALEFFVTDSASNITGLSVNIPSLTQPNTYSTLSKSTCTTLTVLRGTNYNRIVTFDSIGYPLAHCNFLRSSRINVQFTDLVGNLTNLGGNFSLMLVVWEILDEN